MSTAFFDQITGARASYNTAINGYDFILKMKLTEIAGSTDAAQLFNALTDSNVPLAGSDLSAIDSSLAGCWLRDIDATPLGDHKFIITLTYQQSRWGIIQIDAGSHLAQVETTKYLAADDEGHTKGENIIVDYEYPSDYGGTRPSERQVELRDTGEVEQGGTVSVLLPERSRIYTVRQTLDPTTQADAYAGSTNDALWWSGVAGTWLCASIQGTSDMSGVQVQNPTNWVNRYEFQYKSDGWDPEVVYSDDITGNPVPDPVQDLGIKTIRSYERTDFTEMFAGS